MKSLNFLILFTVVIAAIFSSCKKEETPPIPQLPPESSFMMEFDDFQQNKSTNLLIENWLYSTVNVSIFNTIVSANMVIPTIAFNASFNNTPTYIGEQTWQWSYSFNALSGSYMAKLNGITERNNKVKWEMYISKTGVLPFTDFLWFEGSTTDSTSALWTVYENPSSPSVLFDIEWESNSSYTESVLKYTYRNAGSENENSTIEFGRESEGTFNRYYNIFLTKESSRINIEWNSFSKNGRVKSPNYFKDENWHCWNEQLRDDWCD